MQSYMASLGLDWKGTKDVLLRRLMEHMWPKKDAAGIDVVLAGLGRAVPSQEERTAEYLAAHPELSEVTDKMRQVNAECAQDFDDIHKQVLAVKTARRGRKRAAPESRSDEAQPAEGQEGGEDRSMIQLQGLLGTWSSLKQKVKQFGYDRLLGSSDRRLRPNGANLRVHSPPPPRPQSNQSHRRKRTSQNRWRMQLLGRCHKRTSQNRRRMQFWARRRIFLAMRRRVWRLAARSSPPPRG